ncbi:hypothetical protein RKD27_005638 [Streptomyces sp. SAI-126]|uniref:hypothetical protein n=1 Tax=Streptomyces sp. SAI-126 TaxID=3377732 RepID=UPI003C7B8101
MTDRFDLSVPADHRLRKKPLHEATVLQSFACDEAHRHHVRNTADGTVRTRTEAAAQKGQRPGRVTR